MYKKSLNLIVLACLTLFFSCEKIKDAKPIEVEIDNTVALKWSQMTLNHLKVVPNKSPTYVSRTLGYIGLTMYESVVNGSINYSSVASQLVGLNALPKPELGKKYDWETSLNAGQSFIIKKMWLNAIPDHNLRIDSLENAILKERASVVNDTAVINRSLKYGKLIAQNIYNWSTLDGGNLGYTRNFEARYKFPVGPQYWVPPLNGQVSILMPLHPYWGQNRMFVPANSVLEVPQIIEYSTSKTSACYKDFNELFEIQKTLTQEQKEIANWWSDDPSDTYAPPGHTYSLALQLARIKKPNLFTTTSVFAKVGMSVADAFINCWKCKFQFHSTRPSKYIRANINMNFTQYWPEPPFPAFVSGHSSQASAGAEAMISVFGDEISFIDETHKGRAKDVFRNVEYKPRSFKSISQTAIECGISRLYGGIHTRQDNEMGLSEGKKIGANVNNLVWKKAKL